MRVSLSSCWIVAAAVTGTACGDSSPATTQGGAGTGGSAAMAGGGMTASAGTAGASGSGGMTVNTGGGGGDPAGAGGEGGAAEEYTEDPGDEGDGDYTVGPDFPMDPDLTDLGNPKGRSFSFTMPLADSQIFDGTDATLEPQNKFIREERGIGVYVPAAYVDGTEAPILIVQDGDGPGQQPCFNIGCRMGLIANALDNLTISNDPMRQLPPFIVITVQNGGDDGKNSERGLEYDTMSDRFARFINEEVLPAVLNNTEILAAYPDIAFTDNPWGRGAIGCSSGGAATLIMGWFRPDLFRRLITYSGTFVDQQDDDAPEEAMYPNGAWDFHSELELIANTDNKPLRIFVHVSENDLRAGDPEETHHNWVMANQRTAAALAAKDYHYRFVFSENSGHCDNKIFDNTLADTLVWMWRGYHAD